MRCKYCGEIIDQINYGTGPEWVATDPDHGYPYRICRPVPLHEPDLKVKTAKEWAMQTAHFIADARAREDPPTKPLEYKEIPS